MIEVSLLGVVSLADLDDLGPHHDLQTYLTNNVIGQQAADDDAE